jgi:hypothetical protein
MTAFALTMAVIAIIAARIAAYWHEAWRAEVDAHTAECLRRIEYAQAQRRITHNKT